MEFGLKVDSVFKLLSLELWNHPILGNIYLNFVDDKEKDNGPYTTVIIGQNGTGKSNLLRLIIDIFREIENIKKEVVQQKLAKCSYKIRYYLNGSLFEYTNSKRKLLVNSDGFESQLLKNGISIESSQLELPNLIIASSVMLNDRFFVPKDYIGNIYEYLGVRRIKTPSIAGTKTFTRRIVELILDNVENEAFINHVKDVLSLLGYENELKLVFYPRYRDKIFTGKLTTDFLHDFYVKWKDVLKKRKNPPYGHSYFLKHLSEDKVKIKKLRLAINHLTLQFNLLQRGSSVIISIHSKDTINRFKESIKILGSLDLLSEYGLLFHKKSDIDVDEVSSGEYHLFVSMIGIFALIRNNSLVLLDEPDISLHPNWQMQYISFLKEVFKKYSSCHFIMATHSHFLVSDMEQHTSKILALKKENNKIVSSNVPKNTFAWSAEEVLYTVFNIRTSRNAYLEYDLTKLLTLINRSATDFIEIKRILTKINTLEPTEGDPLLIIAEKAKKYLQDNNVEN